MVRGKEQGCLGSTNLLQLMEGGGCLIRTYFSIWKCIFHELDMAGSINAICCRLKTIIGTLSGGVPNKNAGNRLRLEFVIGLRT